MDYHLHTGASRDATGDLADFIEEANRKGLDEIGFSEHLLDYPRRPTDFMDEYTRKFQEIQSNSKIPLKLGVEIDFFPHEENKVRELVSKYPFDYVMGSVHYLQNWLIDSPSQLQEYFKRDILQVYTEYFATVRELCKTRVFDTLGHADIVKIFGFKPKCDITNMLEETAQALAQSDMCVEINTSGLERRCAEIYPSKRFLAILKEHDVPVTLGSDAHKPQDVGRSFNKAFELMEEVGLTHLCTFKDRKRISVEL